MPDEVVEQVEKEFDEVSVLAVRAKDDPALMIELWGAVHKLVCAWAHKYNRYVQKFGTRLWEFDDLVQVGYIALVDAMKGYDAEKGAFIPRLYKRTLTQFNEVAGRSGNRQHPEWYASSLDMTLKDDTDTTQADLLADPDAEFADVVIDEEALRQDCAAIMEEINSLPEDQRRIIMLIGWEGFAVEKAAEDMGITFSEARRHKRNAINHVRNSETGRRIYRDRYPVRHVGVNEFKTTWTSAVEWAVLYNEQRGAI